MIRFASKRWPIFLAVAHVILAVFWGAVNPPYEAHDETGHFAYVSFIAQNLALPNANDDAHRALLDQSHQPPLYYALSAALTGWLPRPADAKPDVNVFAFDGTNRRGQRILLRDPGEDFPWRGEILALHAARLVSALLGGLMIFFIAKTAQLVLGDGLFAAFATALAAFNPQVIFMSSMVNNDVMISLLGAIVAYACLRIWVSEEDITSRVGLTDSPSSSRFRPTREVEFIFVGVALGLALLSKNSSFALAGFALVWLMALARRGRWPLGTLITRAAAIGLPAALLAAPYFASNVLRYGKIFVDRNQATPITQQPASLAGEGILVGLRDQWLPQIFINAFRTFWGAFGWGNVQFPGVVYDLLAAFCFFCLMGGVFAFLRGSKKERAVIGLLAVLGLGMMILPVYRAILYQDPALLPGRYLMPALAAYVCLMAYGWRAFLQITGLFFTAAKTITTSLALLLMALALATPFAILRPAYAAGVQTQPQGATLLTFGGAAKLVGIEAQNVYLPDREGTRQYARVKATWQAAAPSPKQLVFSVAVLGADQQVLGAMNRFPASGNYPSTNWKTGDTWSETYDILIEKPCATLPTLAQLQVNVFEAVFTPTQSGFPNIAQGAQLPAQDANGKPITPIVGRFRLGERATMAVHWQPALAMFDGIGLRQIEMPSQVSAGQPLTVSLTYEMWRNNGKNATVFVHALDASGKPITQDDHTPARGFYPTDFWQPGECVTERFVLPVPQNAPATLHITTGFYNAATGQRFAVDSGGDTFALGDVAVKP